MQYKDTIKHDLKSMRTLLKANIVLSILLILMVIVGPKIIIHTSFGLSILDLLLEIFDVLVVILFISWSIYLEGMEYLIIIKRAGYEVPEDKKKYNSKFSNLPRVSFAPEKYPSRSIGRIILAGINLVIALLYVYRAIDYFMKLSPISDDTAIYSGIVLALACFWGVRAFLIFRQSNNRKYFDPIFNNDTCSNKTKRSRMSSILAVTLVIGILMSGAVYLFTELTGYLGRSRLALDFQKISYITAKMDNIIENKDDYPEDEYNELYSRLVEGFDICNVEWADNSVTSAIAHAAAETGRATDNMNDIENDFYIQAESVYIKLNDEGKCEATYTYLWEYGRLETEIINRPYMAR